MEYLRRLRVPLGAQFFAAAIVMGSVAILMAFSTMSRTAALEGSLGGVESVIEQSGDETAAEALAAGWDALRGSEREGLTLALIVAGIGIFAAGFLTMSVAVVSKRLASCTHY